MGETRINLKHLLEDLRDAYPFTQEEAIITELLANALDSGASEIRFYIDKYHETLKVIDNGKGMAAKEFEEYHDIAATTKVRGKGIGFAGVGVKLSLLIAKKVITETRRKNFHKATSWRLENELRAPWRYTKTPDLISSSTGSAVSIITPNKFLLNPNFIEKVIQKHFFPLLDKEVMDQVLKNIYKDGVSFFVNKKRIHFPEMSKDEKGKLFVVLVRKTRGPIGIGFIKKSKEDLPEEERGIAISTYGKVIKRGWDWVGLSPRNPMKITGIVEYPGLSEILTINKADFLKDSKSLQKYYIFRKAVQKELSPILREFGEISSQPERAEKNLRPLEKEIERVLENMRDNYPELDPLFGRSRKGEKVKGVIPDNEASKVGTHAEGVGIMTGTEGGKGKGEGIAVTQGGLPGERIEPGPEKKESGREHLGRRKRPGLMLGFDDNADREEPGWISESIIWINKGHPAYKRTMNTETENYHIVLSVSWVLSNYLEQDKSPQEFINTFLMRWGIQA